MTPTLDAHHQAAAAGFSDPAICERSYLWRSGTIDGVPRALAYHVSMGWAAIGRLGVTFGATAREALCQ